MSKKMILISLLGMLLLLNGCTGKKGAEKAPAVPVRTTVAAQEKGQAEQEYVGVVEEERSSVISFPVPGTVETMYAEEGQRVRKGELLAALNTANSISTYAAAKAQLAQAEDAMRRVQMMYDNRSIPEIKYIDIRTQLEKARSAEAIAGKNLADSRLTAPFSGVIGRKSVESGENVLPSQPVYTLLKIDDVKVRVSVPEKEIRAILKNQQATLSIPALDGAAYEGSVEELGVVADPVSHSYTVRIRVRNRNGELLTGMVCDVAVRSAANDVPGTFVLPSKCVQTTGGREFVWRVVEGKPVRQVVTTGRVTAHGVEITTGLKGGEEIVTEGYQYIYEGVALNILDR